VHVNKSDMVDVVGAMSISDGERQVDASIVSVTGSAPNQPAPFGMRGEAVGGARFNASTPGVSGAFGANNIGLLVKTWGNVVSTGADYFYIEAKPAIQIKIKSGSLTQPAVGKFVVITGISTCEVLSGSLGRAILPRTQSDIVVLK